MTDPGLPTDWRRYDVPTLAAVLTEDHTRAWDQVTAWRTCYDLVTSERARISRAASELAESWPPARSAAAAAFLESVDMLTSSMTDTAEAAIANSSAMSGVLTALAEAKAEVDRIHAQWQWNVQRDAARAKAFAYSASSSDAAEWQDSLNAQAHRVMITTDQTIFDNSRRLVAPLILAATRRDPITPIPGPTSPATAGLSHRTTASVSNDLGQSNGLTVPSVTARSSPSYSSSLPSSEEREQETASKTEDVPPAAISTPTMSTILATAGGAAIIGSSFPRSGSVIGRGPDSESHSQAISGNRRADSEFKPNVSGTTTHTSAEQSEPMMPMSGVSARPTERSTRKQRARERPTWPVRRGVPSVIEPIPVEEVVHLPGPGVIGIDI